MKDKSVHIDFANLSNLTQLWQNYGARSLIEDEQLQLRISMSWPNRVWADMAKPLTAAILGQVANNIPDTALFPVWPAMKEDGPAAPQETIDALVRNSRDWQPTFQHTAMALQLDKQQQVYTPTRWRYPIHIKSVSDNIDIAVWADVGSKAFGYRIDENVIEPLLTYENTQLLLAYNEDSQPVATGLLFKTAGVVGIHQIGVPVDCQSKGYGTQMMRFVIQCASDWQADYAVLQASEAGRPVYQKLGFVGQFLITYLQRCKN